MTLELKIESLEKVPEALHEYYVKADEGYELDANFSGFKSTLTKVRKERDLALKKARQYKGQIDDEIDKDVLDNLDTDGYRKLVQKERKKYQRQLKDLAGEKDSYIIDKEIRSAALNAGVMSDRIDEVSLITAKNFSFRDGEIEVLDNEGEPLGISPKEFFEGEFKERKPYHYKGSGKSGSGSQMGIDSNMSQHNTSLKTLYDEGQKQGGTRGAEKMLKAQIAQSITKK